MKINSDSSLTGPDLFMGNLKAANGIFLSNDEKSVIFSETFGGVRQMMIDDKELSRICGKSRLVEGFDDLCIDSYGNYWIADPPKGFFKCYIPAENRVVCYHLESAGVASSCRIRVEQGKEYLYVAEIKQSRSSKTYDGRGLFVFSVDTLLGLGEEN